MRDTISVSVAATLSRTVNLRHVELEVPFSIAASRGTTAILVAAFSMLAILAGAGARLAVAAPSWSIPIWFALLAVALWGIVSCLRDFRGRAKLTLSRDGISGQLVGGGRVIRWDDIDRIDLFSMNWRYTLLIDLSPGLAALRPRNLLSLFSARKSVLVPVSALRMDPVVIANAAQELLTQGSRLPSGRPSSRANGNLPRLPG